ncbi:hypothetical protein ON010_g18436 [Phytophthora cinnamomi]|nr:hypothetical protein ON010_g18436 [Phytophthora cinnamomi]
MRSTCPKVADTRWLFMHQCTAWFTRHIIVIQELFAKQTPQHRSAPDTAWWIFVFAANALTQETHTVFVKLQSIRTLLSQQSACVVELLSTLAQLTGMMSDVTSEQVETFNENERQSVEICDGYMLRHSLAEAYVVELDPWI